MPPTPAHALALSKPRLTSTGTTVATLYGGGGFLDTDPSIKMMCSKSACDQCGQRRGAGVTLKQCAGCKVAWYCSKQCQIAAWPYHKIMCTSRVSNTVPPIYATLGRATMAELVHESGAWLQAHKLTLTIIVNALVELRGGVDDALNTPKVAVFKLGPPRAYDGTPATAFTLQSMSCGHPDKFGGITDPQWTPQMVAVRALAAQTFRAAGADAVLAGMLPVTTYLRDATEAAPQTSFPLCRPRFPPSQLMDERALKGTLENLTMMCAGAINAGIVLQVPENPDKVVPDMGKIVPEGKNWSWASHERSTLVGPNGERGLAGEFLRYFKKDLSPCPGKCFETYHKLWPYHVISDAAKQVLEVYPELAGK